MVDKKHGSTKDSASQKAPASTTKKEAIETGLAELGNAATPTQLREYLHERYQLDMSLNQISAAKSKILKAALSPLPVPKPAVAKPPAKQQPAGPKPVSALAATEKGTPEISLRDIETAKGLVERVGITTLKMLIDVMAH